ncbi:hypothetical protein [Amycolatopsis sp. YIM 10]|uniref:hypothetical protein n=1 Tax=Amycolatopsis sp. YIM 10 TaxID=2653857 RepID=UPI00129036D8|nr:hypothetical protein [Amycolatopsis sp. YIM 10]QFU89903.1 hypothetical protein YIM_23630 [Amycolatopsis sp. YIM 10]
MSADSALVHLAELDSSTIGLAGGEAAGLGELIRAPAVRRALGADLAAGPE